MTPFRSIVVSALVGLEVGETLAKLLSSLEDFRRAHAMCQ